MKASRWENFGALVTDWLPNLTTGINYSLVGRSGLLPGPTVPPTSQILQTFSYRTMTMTNLFKIRVSAPVEGLSGGAI
jgi:hypothetical protein